MREQAYYEREPENLANYHYSLDGARHNPYQLGSNDWHDYERRFDKIEREADSHE